MVLYQQRQPTARLVIRDGETPDIMRFGDPHSQWRDLYYLLLTIPWSGFIGLLGLLYVAVNALFALAYLLGGDCIASPNPGSFSDAFFFSVQTMASIGYGAMHPTTVYANWLVVMESFMGLLFIAMATGMIFSRFSLPTARILFSHVAVITQHNNVPTLMFRTANKRRNRILEAQLWVTLVRDEITSEGEYLRRFHDLQLIRSHTPLFALTWTAMHPIDPSSPLYGETPESLAQSRQLKVYQKDEVILSFPVAVGQAEWQTPLGQYWITQMKKEPAWQHPITGEVVESGPDNPLGARWIGFWSDGKTQIGFHGTNQEDSIGQAVSHGCIRLRNQDILDLYERVGLGVPVTVTP